LAQSPKTGSQLSDRPGEEATQKFQFLNIISGFVHENLAGKNPEAWKGMAVHGWQGQKNNLISLD